MHIVDLFCHERSQEDSYTIRDQHPVMKQSSVSFILMSIYYHDQKHTLSHLPGIKHHSQDD